MILGAGLFLLGVLLTFATAGSGGVRNFLRPDARGCSYLCTRNRATIELIFTIAGILHRNDV